MVSAGDFRNGITIELEGNIFQVIEFQHVKPGKGAAFVRTKLKNIKSGGVVEGGGVKNIKEYMKILQEHSPGDVISIEVMRKGKDGYKEIVYSVIVGNG